jgi:uncharacterized protein YprB with RNaseH-like and TPR domain
MSEDLRQRLRELGVVKGVRGLTASFGEKAPAHRRAPIEALVPGHFHTTSHGQCFVVEATYPPGHLHGSLPLSAFLDMSPHVLAQIARDPALSQVNLRRICFLDTETTGLSAGTGTMAFVVGLGFFTEDGFSVHQYFLRDHGDEPAMIEALAELLPTFEALASFNGRAFDVPILENRFILARLTPPTTGVPHLDLLPPARRMWHYHLPSCALGALERGVLGVFREQDDVPGGVIPTLYRDYLRTGDAREMKRVLYHNVVDVLSLVTLAARLCVAFANPWGKMQDDSDQGLSCGELYGLGRWYELEGRPASAERAYRSALSAPVAPDIRPRALRALGYLLKQADRRAEALAYWQQLALEAAPDTADFVLAHVEMAKYFEWHVEDLSLAHGWTQAALAQVESWPPGRHRDVALAELRHRLARLGRKANH